MTPDSRRIPVVAGLALALLVCTAVLAAAAPAATQGGSLVPKAVAFVRTVAKGDMQAAEADFTHRMKQAAPPAKLGVIWRRLIRKVGPFQGTSGSKTVVQSRFITVIVKTDFKSRALGIAVTFDAARRIAGVHFVPPP